MIRPNFENFRKRPPIGNEVNGILVKHQGIFMYHCWILPEAGKLATFWGTMLNWANEPKFTGMGYPLAGLKEGC